MISPVIINSTKIENWIKSQMEQQDIKLASILGLS